MAGRARTWMVLAGAAVAGFFLVRALDPFAPTGTGPESPLEVRGGPGQSGELRTLEGRAGGRSTAAGDEPTALLDGDLPAPPREEPGNPVLQGRVVDARRRPVVGARVLARMAGVPASGVRTDAKGTYRIALGPGAPGSAAASLHAWTDDGRAAFTAVWIVRPLATPRDIVVPVLVLEAARDLVVRVERDGAVVAGARVLVDGDRAYLGPVRVADATTDAQGRVRLPALPLGTYQLAAGAPGHGRGVMRFSLLAEEGTEQPADALVALTAPRAVDVFVVEKDTETPISGATVYLIDQIQGADGSWRMADTEPLPRVPPTDAAGRTRIEGLGAEDRPVLGATAPGFPERLGTAWGGPRTTPLAPDERERRIELARLRDLVFPVKEGESPTPPEGTALVLEADAGAVPATLPKEARIEGGRIVASGFSHGYVHALAVAPDGSYARLFAKQGENEGMETSFLPTRRIDVRVLRADGPPAAGLWVSARTQGNNLLPGMQETDRVGRATLSLRHPYLVEVYVSTDTNPYGGTAIGSVDLKKGDGSIEATLPTERDLRLLVRIDGEPALPGSFQVGVGPTALRILEEDPERGLLVLRGSLPTLGANGTHVLWLRAPGFAPASVPLEGAAGTGPLEATLVLEPAGILEARVLLPRDGKAQVTLETWNEKNGGWGMSGSGGPAGSGVKEPFPGGVTQRFDTLVAGRYRLADQLTGERSEPVEVAASGRPTAVTFDLSRAGVVRGVLEVPDAGDLRLAGVQVQGAGRTGLAADGSFQVRVPGSRPVVLRATHPLLAADPVLGRVEVTGPRDGVRLVLLKGATARFVLAHASAPPEGAPRAGSSAQVHLLRGEVGASPVGTLSAVAVDGALKFGGYEPGTYTLWIDAGAGAPVVLRGVTLGAGETDLGTLTVATGSSIRLRVQVKEGTSVPRVYVSAHHEGPPAYVRMINSIGGDAEVVVTGLGPGRFRVRARPIMSGMGGGGGATQEIDTTIDVDGTQEMALDLDLR